MAWYVKTKQGARGPIEFHKLKELASAGQLKQHHALWKPGMTDWSSASEIAGLFEADYVEFFQTCGHPAVEERAYKSQDSSNLNRSQEFRLKEYISGHWQGKLSLVKSTWINGVLISIIFVFLLFVLSELLINESNSGQGNKLLFYAVLGFTGLQVWQAVGIFRTATTHIRQRLVKIPTLAGIARIYSMLIAANVLGTILTLTGVGGA